MCAACVVHSFASLYQKPRTAEQDALFGQALKVMGDVYASALGTTVHHPTGPHPPSRTSPTTRHHAQVMRHRSVPPRTKSLDGELVVKAKSGAALDGACAMATPSRTCAALTH